MEQTADDNEIKINPSYILAWALAFVILTYAYACLRVLGFAGFSDVGDTFLKYPLSVVFLFVSAVGVAYAGVVLYRKVRKLPKAETGRGVRALLRGCVCVAVAFTLDAALLQYNHYVTLWADGRLSVFDEGARSSDIGFERLALDGGESVYVSIVGVSDDYPYDYSQVKFEGVDRRVNSIYIDAVGTFEVVIQYADEESSLRETAVHTVVEGLEYTHYIPIYPTGRVSMVALFFSGGGFYNVVLNEVIPLSPVPPRILLIAGAIFAFACLRGRDIFSVRFDAGSRKQRAGFVVMLACLFAFFALISITNYNPVFHLTWGSDTYDWENQYEYLTEALANGRLDIEMPFDTTGILSASRPFDQVYLMANSIEFPHDTVMYGGKFYVYFGVVPSVLFMLPYRLVTGAHLPIWAFMLFFGYMCAVFLCLIWYKVCARFIRDMPLILFYLGTLVLVFCSFVPYTAIRHAQYNIAQLSALMFVLAGVYLLLKYDEDEKGRLAFLGLGCLCFALAVGCRPSMVFWSALVLPFALRGIGKNRETLKKALTVTVPYIMVAVPLMLYNYLRFGSIFEFGVRYMLTDNNFGIFNEYMFPIKAVYICAAASKGYLFTPPRLSSVFPFVSPTVIPEAGAALRDSDFGVIGLFILPISFFLFGYGRVYDCVKKASATVALALPTGLIVALVMIVITPFLGGTWITTRYAMDFFWFAVLVAAVTALLLKERVGIPERLYWRFTAAIMAVSALIGFFCIFSLWHFAHGYNLASWYYFARVFNIFGGV